MRKRLISVSERDKQAVITKHEVSKDVVWTIMGWTMTRKGQHNLLRIKCNSTNNILAEYGPFTTSHWLKGNKLHHLIKKKRDNTKGQAGLKLTLESCNLQQKSGNQHPAGKTSTEMNEVTNPCVVKRAPVHQLVLESTILLKQVSRIRYKLGEFNKLFVGSSKLKLFARKKMQFLQGSSLLKAVSLLLFLPLRYSSSKGLLWNTETLGGLMWKGYCALSSWEIKTKFCWPSPFPCLG